jgi:aryl-alcohol dehydrogenase-like predicted oxidoreductase
MEFRPLGSAGAQVSPLCLGTMTFGEADENSFMHKAGCDVPASHAIMSAALDAGVNFFDTANIYGQDGLSERVVGDWFAKTGRRNEVMLATKFRFRSAPYRNGAGASRRHIMLAVEESLRRLQSDRIDLYQIHMQDVTVPEEETLRALDDLIHQGKVLYIGASNYAAYRFVHSQMLSRMHGLAAHCVLQVQYSLAVRNIELEHIPACRTLGAGVLAWSPLAGGFLSGKYSRDHAPGPGTRFGATQHWRGLFDRYAHARGFAILDALHDAAKACDAPPAAVALAWVMAQPSVTAAIFGARTLAQLSDNLRATELRLPAEVLAALSEASRVPLEYPYDFMRNVQGAW